MWGPGRGERGAGRGAWQLCAHSPSLGTSQPVSKPFSLSCRGETACFRPRTAMACMEFPPAVCGRGGSGILPTTPPREQREVRHGPAVCTRSAQRRAVGPPPYPRAPPSPHLGDVSAVGACCCERRRRSSAVAGRWAPARRVACSQRTHSAPTLKMRKGVAQHRACCPGAVLPRAGRARAPAPPSSARVSTRLGTPPPAGRSAKALTTRPSEYPCEFI